MYICHTLLYRQRHTFLCTTRHTLSILYDMPKKLYSFRLDEELVRLFDERAEVQHRTRTSLLEALIAEAVTGPAIEPTEDPLAGLRARGLVE